MEIMHHAWMDYYGFYYDYTEWETRSKESDMLEEQWHRDGIGRALANVQSAWDKIRLHLRPNLSQRAQFPVEGSTRHSTLAPSHRRHALGMVKPLTQMFEERRSRESLEEDTLGMTVSKEVKEKEKDRNSATLSRQPPRLQRNGGVASVFGTKTKGEGDSVTNATRNSLTKGEGLIGSPVTWKANDKWWEKDYGSESKKKRDKPSKDGQGTC